ncbi:UBP-type zinc finger domain-containing protein [Thermoleptolyngbya sichuanensis A183]|uniref:UBP-type zinc finger domain-containing protein n=1 Tax=Thermoleptolyngbya sichuanensis A183 TaxID=2737172 RepID=A0A6M8BD05_9CYAN|nr:UBP-type zinc finger domain-containing protein [Thermoleptolyngbya sichuanensis A183]
MSCEHLNNVTLETLIPKANFPVFRCEECIRINSQWVHLRICQTCGKMLCCDSSKHQHARRHYEETGHPVMSSAELGEGWLWCFVDEAAKEY